MLVMVLAPVSLVAGWASSQLSDADRFMATYGPLGSSAEVRQLIGDSLTEAIVGRLGLVGRLPATRSAVADAADAVIASDAFTAAWTISLRLAHAQLTSLLAADPGSAEGDDKALQLQLGPFADAVKQHLIGAGVPFADLIPEVDAAVTIVQLDADTVTRMRIADRLLAVGAAWLPWLSLILAIATVLAWPTRRGGLLLAGCAVMAGAAALTLALFRAGVVLPALAPESLRSVAALFTTTTLAAFPLPVLALFAGGAAAVLAGCLVRAKV